MQHWTALLDANVLYQAGVRDILLRLADRGLFTPLWTAQVHDEWIRNLISDRPDLTAAKLQRTRSKMDEYFPEALVTGYESQLWGPVEPAYNVTQPWVKGHNGEYYMGAWNWNAVYSITIGGIIVSEASLSFLGFGLPHDVPSWGGMLSRKDANTWR